MDVSNAEEETFERLRAFLYTTSPFSFCVVYRVAKAFLRYRPKWHKAISPYEATRADYDKLAKDYSAIAAYCFKNERDLILEEGLPTKGQKSRKWCGLVWYKGEKVPLPTNAIGQRWRLLVVGSGATHDAGYAIVARVAAMDKEDVLTRIEGIQKIMSGQGS